MMQNQGKKRAKRLRKMIIVCVFCAILLTVSTYAWFVGLRSVSVSNFDVEIAVADSLMLSLDGSNWYSEINISKATINSQSYTNHTNTWGGDGLIPMSTIGDMNEASSTMKIYEQASFTKTDGGYRIMASRVNNYTGSVIEGENDDPDVTVYREQDGYVAFDLFIRNVSGTQYLPVLNEADEEAIYLTTDSKVTIAADGVANTGIENSVRVAYTQIGRVIGTETNQDVITGIKCADTYGNGENPPQIVTKICRNARIWEPNDKAHVENAISYYDTSCRKRIANGSFVLIDDDSTQDIDETKCNTVEDNNAYSTYAVAGPITSADAVDIYDGEDFNGYTSTVTNGKLVDFPYFTDTMKMQTGTARQPFMTLAPNSITKLRIYIYIEGQDIDNYDFAALGKKITIAFGFTKIRFVDEDIDYTENGGPTLPTALGKCDATVVGANVPTTKATCDAAHGNWNTADSTCSGNTKQYCDAVSGYFVANTDKGICTSVTDQTIIPTTQNDCIAAKGKWTAAEGDTPGYCTGDTYGYCTNVNGSFQAYKTLGTCNTEVEGATVPTTKAACEQANGTYTAANGETSASCVGNTFGFCNAVSGSFTAYSAVGTCTPGTVPNTSQACTSAGGTWVPEEGETPAHCTGNTYGYCTKIGGTFATN